MVFAVIIISYFLSSSYARAARHPYEFERPLTKHILRHRLGEPLEEEIPRTRIIELNGRNSDDGDYQRRSLGTKTKITRRRKNNEGSGTKKDKSSDNIDNYGRLSNTSPLREVGLRHSASERTYFSKKGEATADDDYYYDDNDYYNDYEESRRQGYSNGHDDGGSDNGINPLALLVAPLAGIALLSAAAAVALNPFLVQISVSKRRRRSLLERPTSDVAHQLQELQILEEYLGNVPQETSYQSKLMASYLTCSGFTSSSNFCMDRVFCEYGSTQSSLGSRDRNVIAIILYNIMSNTQIDQSFKDRLKTAAQFGRDGSNSCRNLYQCQQVDNAADPILALET